MNTANQLNKIQLFPQAKQVLEEKLNYNFTTKDREQFNQCVNWLREFLRCMNNMAGDDSLATPDNQTSTGIGIYDLGFLGKLSYHRAITNQNTTFIYIRDFDFNSSPMPYPLVESKHLEENKEIKRIKEIMGNICH